MASGFFKQNDAWVSEFQGYPLGWDWWSRCYEYPWAFQYAKSGMDVADMGCGYERRPFKDGLAQVCKHVYAVDIGSELLFQEPHDNMQFVVADFTERIEAIPDGSLDAVFCISVLEDLGDRIPFALQEFSRCLKPSGLCLLTCDVQYDLDKPLGPFPAVALDIDAAAREARLLPRDWFDSDKQDAVYHVTFNLCVAHYELVKL
jgi:SAM-dependent methyltransferase